MENKDFAVLYLTDHRKDLLEKRERMMRPLQELDQEIEHVTATLRSIQKPLLRVESQVVADFPIGKLRKLTQVQALVEIAKQNNGIIRAQEAKRLLIRAGVMRETKNSTNVIHAVIIRSEKFERVRPGEYRLKEMKSLTGNEGAIHAPVQ